MKMKRRVKVFFTMDPDIYKLFETHINNNLLDKSKLLESIIKEFIHKQVQ